MATRILHNGVILDETIEDKSPTYKGFSSREWRDGKSFGKSDIDIVKEDLLNHIYTEYGERVHMPNFGTRIPSLIFELNDKETIDILEEDLNMVFDYDPRVETIDLQILPVPDNNAIVAVAVLKFVELDIVDELKLEFNTI